jgi:hypothetical protein
MGDVPRKTLARLSVLMELFHYHLPVLLQHLLLGPHERRRI